MILWQIFLKNQILNRVYGIDINPLSVLSARVGYYLALKPFGELKNLDIPVYLGDSAIIGEKIMIENEKIEEMMMELEEKCENSLNALDRDYGAIRTGRANPRILDRLEVEAYGGMSKLIELV